MGGIKVGVDHQSSIPGLYAIGECACQYHGANRLGSNSLLAAIHGGFTAAEQISGRLDGISEKNPVDLERGEKAAIAEMEASFNSEGVPFIKAMQTMHQTMDVCMNIERNGPDLQRGFDTLNKLADKVAESGINALNTFDSWRAQKLLSLAKAMILSALAREESRGAHMRSDFPETDENFQKTTVMQNDHPTVTFEEIPQEERP
jgi:succinate dehydrogenase / fumarate reductase flavoprotein subunit